MTTVQTEWLETNGLGGYASGTALEYRTRKYHGILCTAKTPPTNRIMLVNDLEMILQHDQKTVYLTPQNYIDNRTRLSDDIQVSFSCNPWPTWEYTVQNFGKICKEILFVHNEETCIVRLSVTTSATNWQLTAKPMLSGRSHHAVCTEKKTWSEQKIAEYLQWQKDEYTVYCGYRNCNYLSNAHFYENFLYEEEKIRGYEYIEHCFCPGEFYVTTAGISTIAFSSKELKLDINAYIQKELVYKQQFNTVLEKAADQFIVKRITNASANSAGYENYTIIAGYPWFTDWGRDTFIAMRGLLLSTKRFQEAESILVYWAKQIHKGLLPNRYIDETGTPEFNSVDAPLWFVIVCYEFLQSNGTQDRYTRILLQNSCTKIIEHYLQGTDFCIHATPDGLLYAGTQGIQLTWMDAKYGDHVITPRIGKPVEINALWINALHCSSLWTQNFTQQCTNAKTSFGQFWNQEKQCLYDVIETQQTENSVDDSVRCNQLLAIGGLPTMIVDASLAATILHTVEQQLLTPLGVRTLAKNDPQYIGNYHGDQQTRDAAYHQGTVWPWWLGPYADAYFTIYGISNASKAHIEHSVVTPLYEQLFNFGYGGICEVADGDEPHTPNGCPWQAWSLGELLRIQQKYSLKSVKEPLL